MELKNLKLFWKASHFKKLWKINYTIIIIEFHRRTIIHLIYLKINTNERAMTLKTNRISSKGWFSTLNFSSSQMWYNFHHKLSRKRIKYHRSNIYSNKILLSIKIIYKIITSCILYRLNDDNKWNSLLEIISRSSVIQESTSQKYRRVKISNYLATNVSINLPDFLDYRDLEGFRDERRSARTGRELECLL